MYILYGGDYTRAMLVQWLLEEGGLKYEFRRIDILKGEHRTPEFLALNPAGLVPVLITPEGDALYEVAALMLYLADRHQLSALAPAVTDPERGRFLSALFYIASEVQPDMKRFHFPHRYSFRAEDNNAVQDAAKALVLGRLEVVDTRLAKGGPYLLGARFSLADFYLCFWIALLGSDAVRKGCPAVARLYDAVRSRPGAQRYLADAERIERDYAELMKKNPAGVIA